MFYKFYGWFAVVLGTIAIIGGIDDNSVAAFAGGSMFVTAGVCILQLIQKK